MPYFWVEIGGGACVKAKNKRYAEEAVDLRVLPAGAKANVQYEMSKEQAENYSVWDVDDSIPDWLKERLDLEELETGKY